MGRGNDAAAGDASDAATPRLPGDPDGRGEADLHQRLWLAASELALYWTTVSVAAGVIDAPKFMLPP